MVGQKLTDTTTAPSQLAAILDRLGRLLHYRQFAAGLNPAQWEALRFIDRANHYSRNPGALAEYLGTTKGTASQTVAALVRKGYLRRVGDKLDRRVHRLMLTDESQELLRSDPLQQLSQALETLTQEERWQLAVNMEKVLRQLIHI